MTGNAGGQSVTNSPPGLRPAPATPQAEDRASTLGSATATATRRRRRRLRVRRRRDRATGAVAGGRWPLLQSLGRHPPWEADTKRKQPAELLACCRGAFLFPAVCYAASFSRAIPACGRRVFYLFSLQKIVFYLSVNWFRSTFLPPTSEVTDHQSSRGSLGFTSPPTVAAKFSTSVLPTKGK